ncbi:ATP-dependent zinc protease family protein [Endozoicomonas euniceicola]|uniref:RimK/LysX family protein n=1 Tax=Endozoicomonas euniceicola TaxID=1234143 RepID=A0ABY6H2S5_9GAMM|nr:RimK/LysX family protein [Endozoicomonas euniceicola]UYM18924.1 RimK/LysX family protein [Endozoicomonas euniceicola]
MTRFPAITALILTAAALTGCQSLPPTEPPAGTTKTKEDRPKAEKPASETQEPPPVKQPAVKQVVPTQEATITQTYIQTPAHIDGKLVLGFAEEGKLPALGLTMQAKIDTGASRTSLDARNIQQFERDGRPWVRFELTRTSKGTQKLELPVQDFVYIKIPDEDPQRRPVVNLTIQIGSLTQPLAISLNDRSNFEYPMLVGRDFLQDLAIVDVGKSYIATEKPLKTLRRTVPKAFAHSVARIIYQKVSVAGLPVIGALEQIHLDGVNKPLRARVDTGANTSSLGASDLEEFEKNGHPWVRFKLFSNKQSFNFELPVSRYALIKRHGGLESQRRPVVKMTVKVGSISKTAEFTLRDRSSYEYPVLLAEQFLANTALVDVSEDYIADKLPRGNQ